MKIVITQNSLTKIAGSEVVALELASFFKKKKWDVVVYTWLAEGQMSRIFQDEGIYVTTDDNDPKLRGADYVWVHHQALPRLILLELLERKRRPFFIFNHMSSLADLYLEQPYIPTLEQKIASANLFCSQRVMEAQTERYGNIFKNCLLFQNPAPKKFFMDLAPKKCEKVLIVSNHPPEEIKEARKILEAKGIRVETRGEHGDNYKIIAPKELKENDCVISIGKTVQYCLVSGVPAYIYDHFGGCGFLNSKNFEKAASFQFSGKEFGKKSAEAIAEEIIELYEKALAYASSNRAEWRKRFGLDENIKTVLSSLEERNEEITKNEVNSYLAAQGIVKGGVINNYILRARISDLESRITSIENSKAYRAARKIGEIKKKITRK